MTALPHQARQILARLELVSSGTTQAFNSSGRAAERDPRPSGWTPAPQEPEPLHLFYRAKMTAEPARIDHWIREAEQALEQVVKGNRTVIEIKPELPHQRRARMLRDGEGESVQVVALAFRCSHKEVIDTRRDADRDTSTGRRLVPVAVPDVSEAVRLRVLGWSFREVERRTGVKRSTLHRHMREDGRAA